MLITLRIQAIDDPKRFQTQGQHERMSEVVQTLHENHAARGLDETEPSGESLDPARQIPTCQTHKGGNK